MKQSLHFAVLMLTMAMLSLAISLPATKSARAAQSGEEPIKATLEDANVSLGGGFVLDPDNSTMTRTRPGTYSNGDPVDITDYLSITSETPNTYCNSYPGEFWHPSTFHGKDGCTLTYGDHPANVIWEVPFGSQSRGDDIVLDVGSIVDGCYCFVQHPDQSQRVSYDSINAIPMAEALDQAAIKNGLYEPPPGEAVSGQPEVSTDQTVPADTGGLFGIPWPIMLGSLGIPVTGALAGAAVAGAVAAVPTELSIAAERWTAANLHPLVELFPFDLRMDAFKADMQKIDDQLIRDKKYVANTWSGYPFVDGATSGVKWVGDVVERADNLLESDPWGPETKTPEGWTCKDYVDYAHPLIQQAAETHFPGAAVTQRRLVEQSTLDVENKNYGPLDYLDWKFGGDQGHIFDKLETKNGSAKVILGVDLWSHNVNHVPIVRPYDEVTAPWKNAVGVAGEFRDIEWKGKLDPP